MGINSDARKIALAAYLQRRSEEAHTERTCVICGDTFRALKRLNRLVCGISCRNKMIGQNNALRAIPRRAEREAEKIRLKEQVRAEKKLEKEKRQIHLLCSVCGITFIQRKHHKNSQGQK